MVRLALRALQRGAPVWLEELLDTFEGALPALADALAPRGAASLTHGRASPPPPFRTKRTRRVPHTVLIGHTASLTPY